MDKKITEITILQKDTSNNTSSISSLNNRVREIEISLAKHIKINNLSVPHSYRYLKKSQPR